MSDITSEFIAYYKSLPTTNCLCRIYERSDDFFLYGDDTIIVNKMLSTLRIKTLESGKDSLSYVKLNKGHLIRLLRHLLFVLQYRIEILRNTGSIRSPIWSLVGKVKSICYGQMANMSGSLLAIDINPLAEIDFTNFGCKASPGNLTAVEDFLFSEENSYVMTQKGLIAIKVAPKAGEMSFGIAFCDALLREIQICEFSDTPQLSILQSVLAQLSPLECLLQKPKTKQSESSIINSVEETLKSQQIAVTYSGEFDSQFVVQDLNRLLKLDEGQDFLSAMKDESEMKLALSCVSAIIKYLELLSDENSFGQYYLSIFKSELYAKVDSTSEVGLGLFPESKSDNKGKHLFGLLNSCSTSAGARLLIQWIKQPLMDIRKLEERLDIVEIFINNLDIQRSATKVIQRFLDVEMLSRKIQKHKATLQDLYKMFVMLKKLPELNEMLLKYEGPHVDVMKGNFTDDIQEVLNLQERIEDFENFLSMISQTIDFEAVQSGDFIVKAEYDESLKDLKKQMDKLKKKMDSEWESTKDDLGLPSLRLEQFEKIGYVFRITIKEENRIRNKKYIIIDTRNSGVRFHTHNLKVLNEEYIIIKKQYEEKQETIVKEMVDVSVSFIPPLKQLGSTLSRLDVALSLARTAVSGLNTYVRPKLREKGQCHIVLKKCRHPVLENLVDYIPNDIEITKENYRFYFVTGPNMGGKSTFIRSVAINVLMAQIGSFVPCEEADITVVDAFFTRIGAHDNPSKAVSTFMYEMLEVKNILKYATPSSLLVIDEMGRGTSTFDGLGLSWSISNHIAQNIRAPCLFATHFHNLTELSETNSCIGNLHVDALCSEKAVTFLYRIKPGVCSQSFGIHVAKLADFPEAVLEDATLKLKELEESHTDLEEICKMFSKVKDGEKFIQYLKSVLTETSKDNIENMEVDDVENTFSDPLNRNVSNLSSKSKLSEAQNLLKILETMEKDKQ